MGYLTDGLTFNTLRGGNLARLPLFKDAKGRVCHSPVKGQPAGFDWELSQWSNAVCGELGEAANLVKKIERGDFSLEEGRQDLADELADVAIYLDLLAHRAGVDLGRAIMDKWNRKSRELGIPIVIEADDWHYTENQKQSPTPH